MLEKKQHTTYHGTVINYQVDETGTPVIKECVRCHTEHPLTKFTNLKGSFLGKFNHCHDCSKKDATALRRKAGALPQQPELGLDPITGDTIRPCSKCELKKSLSEFDINPSGFLGHDSECKECKRRRGELYRRSKGIKPTRVVPVLRDEQGEVTHRECARCITMQPITNFNKHRLAYLGIHPYCKSCDSERTLVVKYGLTLKDREDLYATQGNGCAICKDPVDIKAIHVDHCHTTGVTRGLLCNSCNTALGHVRENEQICENMITYIRRYKNVDASQTVTASDSS